MEVEDLARSRQSRSRGPGKFWGTIADRKRVTLTEKLPRKAQTLGDSVGVLERAAALGLVIYQLCAFCVPVNIFDCLRRTDL